MNHVKKRTRWIIGIIAIVMILAALGLTRIYASNKSFEVTLDEAAVGGTVETRLYSADNQVKIGDFLREQGYPVDSTAYNVDTDLNTTVSTVDAVTITHNGSDKVAAASEPIVNPTRVTELAESNTAIEQETADDLAAAEATTREEKKEIRYVDIPFETEQIENADLVEGTEKVTTEGVTGSKKVTEKVIYENGVETSRELLSEKVVAEPVNAVIEVGTKPSETTKEETRQETLAYSTETRENPELEKGVTNTLVKGENGLVEITEQVTYNVDGIETGRKEIKRTVIKEAKAEVIEVGTKETVQEQPDVPDDTEETEPVQPEVPVEPEEPAKPEYPTESVSDKEFDMICAIVAQEDNSSYDGALAVISCVMNRVDEGNWGGSTALDVLKAPGQFSAYLDATYQKYLNGRYPDYVAQAVRDCMTSGIRNHGYTSFRGYRVDGSEKIGGNWYF